MDVELTKIPKKIVPTSPKGCYGEGNLGINREFAAKHSQSQSKENIEKSTTYGQTNTQQATKNYKKRYAKNKAGEKEKTPEQLAAEAAARKAHKEWWNEFRHAMHAMLRLILIHNGLYDEMKSLVNCGCYPIPEFVKKKNGERVATGHPGTVVASFYKAKPENELDARIGYAHLQHCGNANLCFLDAPKIRYFRSEELKKITSFMLNKKFQHMFLTFTAPHNANTDPIAFVDNFNKAIRLFKSYTRIGGYRYADIKEEFGLSYNVTTREMTCDNPKSKYKTGNHYHAHQLMFIEPEYKKKWKNKHKTAEKFYTIISNRWVECLIRTGLIKNDDEKTVANALKFLSITESPVCSVALPKYNKNIKRTEQELIEYMSKGAGIELSPGIFTKNARIPNKINHWSYIVLCLTKYRDEIPAMINVVRALKAHHWMSFSKGLRKFCEMADVEDKEILEGNTELRISEFFEQEWSNVGMNAFQHDLTARVVKNCEKNNMNLADIVIDESGHFVSGLDTFLYVRDQLQEHINFIITNDLSPLTNKPRDFQSLQDIMENEPKYWQCDDCSNIKYVPDEAEKPPSNVNVDDW